MKKYLVSFCDRKYIKTLNRLKFQAHQMGVFDHVCCYDETILDSDFIEKYKYRLQTSPRGFGYWVWKPYVILKTLEKMEENDILVWVDGGCTLNPNGIKRLHEYFDIIQKSPFGILGFQIGVIEKQWSKMDLLKELEVDQDENILNSQQVISGAFFLRKCEHTMKIMNKWNEIIQMQHLIDDSPSIAPNVENFAMHRHDQSVFSILMKKYGSELIGDETYFKQCHPESTTDGTNFPVWATRIKY